MMITLETYSKIVLNYNAILKITELFFNGQHDIPLKQY